MTKTGSKKLQARRARTRQKARERHNNPMAAKSASARYDYSLPVQYLDDRFWARPDKCKTGAPDAKVIYLGVGHALSNWEHVEASMSMLFSVFVDSFSTAASRAYGSIFGSRAKADAVAEAAKVFFAIRRSSANQRDRDFIEHIDKTSAHCEALIQNYRKASSRRNDIAHGMAYEMSYTIGEGQKSWFLIPPMYQSSHRGEVWTADDIKLRKRKRLKMAETDARPYFIKMVFKNCEYIFGVSDIKIFAGKFAHLSKDLQLFVRMFRPDQIPFDSASLEKVAQELSR